MWKSLGRNGGCLVLALVVYGWFIADRQNPALLAIGSGLIVLFALFFAESPCAAVNKEKRDGEVDFCGNNGHGLLGACHLKRHEWENLKALGARQRAARAARHTVSRSCGRRRSPRWPELLPPSSPRRPLVIVAVRQPPPR